MSELKPGWQRVKFGEIAECVNDRVDDPAKAGVARYVGLEHLDPESLVIRRWGTPDEVESTKLRFRAGDIIFGKRRAYQRKLAVAAFDGICSAHAMVLRAKPGAVLHEFLPFFMQSDAFMERAQAISVGSLSPTINWKMLANQEFALPPLDEQHEIVTALDAAHKNADAVNQLVVAANVLLDSTLLKLFDGITESRELSEYCASPIARGIDQAGPDVPGGVPYIRVTDMTRGETLSTEGMLRTSEQIAKRFSQATVKPGDIVVALRGPLGLPRIVPPALDGANLTQGTVRISVRPDYDRDYVFWALKSPYVAREMLRRATGWKGESLREITLAAMRKLPIPWMPPHEQRRVSSVVNEIAHALTSARLRHTASQDLRRTLIDELCGGVP